MKRWLIWFAIGGSAIFLSVITTIPGPDKPGAVSALLGLGFIVWGIITMWAVPIAIIYWLVKGRRKPTVQA